MQNFPEPTSSDGCLLTGCVIRLGIPVLILLIIGEWVVPSVFRAEIEARVCPDGSELRSYTRTTNGTNTSQGHACYDKNLIETRDLGARLIIPSVLITILGIIGIVVLIIMGAFRSTRQTLSTLLPMQGGTIIRSNFPFIPTGGGLPQNDDDDLAGRLQQLNEALNAGLITQDEYEAKRQQIISRF